MGLTRHETRYPGPATRTETETKITGDVDFVYRAKVNVEVSGPLTRAELEALLSLVVLDLTAGNVKAGGERYDDLCLAYAQALAAVTESLR